MVGHVVKSKNQGIGILPRLPVEELRIERQDVCDNADQGESCGPLTGVGGAQYDSEEPLAADEEYCSERRR